MGPHLVKIRGVDGFWQGQLATSQVPREVILAILAKVEQTDKNERLRVARFLIQAEWYAEARAELDRIAQGLPRRRRPARRVPTARASVVQLEAVQLKAEIDRCRRAQQPARRAALLKTFPTKDVSADLLVQVREQLQRNDEAQAAADKALADDLRALAERLPKPIQKPPGRSRSLEVAQGADRGPRRRPRPVRRLAEGQGRSAAKPTEAQFALAMSGYVVGADAAVDDLEAAATLWTVRDQVREYLDRARRPSPRRASSRSSRRSASPPTQRSPSRSEAARHWSRGWPCGCRRRSTTEEPTAARRRKIHRVQRRRERRRRPSTPSCFRPSTTRSGAIPAVVALHDGATGPQAAIAWWSAEAARRGYIVIAPEYTLPGQGKDYRYTASEHAAVELALRDAKRRYAIDGDRVFLGGQLVGGEHGLGLRPGPSRPVRRASSSSRACPFKYVYRYLPHAEQLPLYVALGDLAPAAERGRLRRARSSR